MKEDVKLFVECLFSIIASTALFVVALPLIILSLPFLIVIHRQKGKLKND